MKIPIATRGPYLRYIAYSEVCFSYAYQLYIVIRSKTCKLSFLAPHLNSLERSAKLDDICDTPLFLLRTACQKKRSMHINHEV